MHIYVIFREPSLLRSAIKYFITILVHGTIGDIRSVQASELLHVSQSGAASSICSVPGTQSGQFKQTIVR